VSLTLPNLSIVNGNNYKEHRWWSYSKRTNKKADRVINSTLHTEKDKIYLEGIAFLEPHYFLNKDLHINKTIEESVKTILFEKGPLRDIYTFSGMPFRI